ncbi:PQ-loop domain-containing transporter, partial [Streptococcus suis]
MIGFVAACLTTFGFLPQVIQVVKTKETQAISLG